MKRRNIPKTHVFAIAILITNLNSCIFNTFDPNRELYGSWVYNHSENDGFPSTYYEKIEFYGNDSAIYISQARGLQNLEDRCGKSLIIRIVYKKWYIRNNLIYFKNGSIYSTGDISVGPGSCYGNGPLWSNLLMSNDFNDSGNYVLNSENLIIKNMKFNKDMISLKIYFYNDDITINRNEKYLTRY